MPNKKFKKRNKPIREDYKPPFEAEVLSLSVTVLGLREDTAALLEKAGIATLYDVVVREEKDFYRISTFNKKNLFDVKNSLKGRKLFLRPSAQPEDSRKEQRNNDKPVDKNARPSQNREKERRDAKTKEQAKYKEENFVMTVKPPKPPRPKIVPVREEPDAYVKVNKGGKWGFKERNGKQKVEPVYDEVFCYKENLCCVEKDEKFGFIDREGEVVIPLVYDCATSFSEGYAVVFKKDKGGYIDRENNNVTDFVFDAATPVVDGECRVKKDGKWGEMHISKNENGDTVVSEIRWIN